MRKFITLIALCTLSLTGPAFSENNPARTLSILPTTDLSGYNLGEPLQYALGQLYQSTGAFQVQLANYQLLGFGKQEIAKTFQAVQSQMFSFTYMEKQRISVFLFDSQKPGGFIVAYRPLNNPPNGQLTSEFIEGKFRECVNDALGAYQDGQFQPLPGDDSSDSVQDQQKAEEARRLFREIAALEEKTWYIGANVGMARFSANATSASTVDFGGYAGARLGERMKAELGLDLFTYALLHGDLRYALPVAEKYINLSATLGAASFLGRLTENKGASSTTTQGIRNGQMVFGPGFGFEVPLLGATLRGDLRLYLGSATVLLGSYGVVINL